MPEWPHEKTSVASHQDHGAAALEYAERITTTGQKVDDALFAELSTRYQSTLLNPQFLRARNLPVPEWLERPSTIKQLVDSVMGAG